MTAASASWPCFTSPLSSGVTIGADPAYDPDFLQLGKETERSRSLHGPTTDWSFVASESARILRDQVKDLRAASWLVVATANLSGWPGAAEGLTGYAAFVERFWDAAHPLRPRARASFVAWLWDGLARALEERVVGSDDRASLRELDALVSQLDATFAGHLGEANPGAAPFRKVVRDRLASLPEDEPMPVPPVEAAVCPIMPAPIEEVDIQGSRDQESDASEGSAAPTDPMLSDGAEEEAEAPDPTASANHAPSDDDTALEELVSRALALPSRRERFLATLRVATVARTRADTDVALALCERLLPEVDATLEAWEPNVCLDLFETYLVTLDASEVDGERSALRSQLFHRLLALNPPLAFRLRASREGV